MQSFEERWRNYMRESDTTEEQLAKDFYVMGQFDLNNELGIAANEAAKAERRKVAVAEILRHDWTTTDDLLDAIIKAAQG